MSRSSIVFASSLSLQGMFFPLQTWSEEQATNKKQNSFNTQYPETQTSPGTAQSRTDTHPIPSNNRNGRHEHGIALGFYFIISTFNSTLLTTTTSSTSSTSFFFEQRVLPVFGIRASLSAQRDFCFYFFTASGLR